MPYAARIHATASGHGRCRDTRPVTGAGPSHRADWTVPCQVSFFPAFVASQLSSAPLIVIAGRARRPRRRGRRRTRSLLCNSFGKNHDVITGCWSRPSSTEQGRSELRLVQGLRPAKCGFLYFVYLRDGAISTYLNVKHKRTAPLRSPVCRHGSWTSGQIIVPIPTCSRGNDHARRTQKGGRTLPRQR